MTSLESEVVAPPDVVDGAAAGGAELSDLLTPLTARFSVREIREQSGQRSYLDTSDRRLVNADLTLWWERGRRRLVLEGADGRWMEQTAVSTRWPARLDGLADGAVRRVLLKPVGIRALLPHVEVSVTTTTYAVLDDDGKTVARVERSRGVLQDGRPLPDRIRVERLRGYDGEADWVEKRLRLEETPGADHDWSRTLRAVPVPGQVAARSQSMTADQPAAAAIAEALLDNLAQIEASLEGIRRDLDVEYLHDLRVAVRRTRSVLKLLGDVLPGGEAAWAVAEFRWLGQVTTPARDLDVYVGELPDLARDLARPGDLDAFARHVTAKRTAAYATLRRALRSARFRALVEKWGMTLEGVIEEEAASGALTAGQLADQRLHRTFRKVARRAKAISAGSESEDIHDLRKACKELRYLLEVFRPLCDPSTFKAVTADFKGLQDVLGEFQDGEVQAAALREFAEEMLAERTANAATLLSMGELAGRFDERQRAARARLLDRHMTHLGHSVARHIDHVVATRPAG